MPLYMRHFFFFRFFFLDWAFFLFFDSPDGVCFLDGVPFIYATVSKMYDTKSTYIPLFPTEELSSLSAKRTCHDWRAPIFATVFCWDLCAMRETTWGWLRVLYY